MLDIKEMLKTHNFTALIRSTQEQRDFNGGNEELYKQLSSYLKFAYVREITHYTFRDDVKIMLKMKNLKALEPQEDLNLEIDLEKFPWIV